MFNTLRLVYASRSVGSLRLMDSHFWPRNKALSNYSRTSNAIQVVLHLLFALVCCTTRTVPALNCPADRLILLDFFRVCLIQQSLSSIDSWQHKAHGRWSTILIRLRNTNFLSITFWWKSLLQSHTIRFTRKLSSSSFESLNQIVKLAWQTATKLMARIEMLEIYRAFNLEISLSVGVWVAVELSG